ncbi:MAG TPA: hypothetical protein VLC28_08380 [Flavitalea sp.]|nr:hypothetical protein [Flavitalea sp.]
MKPFYVLLASAIVIASPSCMPSMKVTADWTNKEAVPVTKFTRIFIAALTSNIDLKRRLESDFEKYAVTRGLQVVKSGDLFFPNFDEKNAPDKETVIKKIRDAGCDGIFSIASIDNDSGTRHKAGDPNYSPMTYSYNAAFWDYYNYHHTSLYAPGYYSTNKTYYLESNVYDLRTEKLLWSIQSEAYDPTSIKRFSKQYADLVTKRLQQQTTK